MVRPTLQVRSAGEQREELHHQGWLAKRRPHKCDQTAWPARRRSRCTTRDTRPCSSTQDLNATTTKAKMNSMNSSHVRYTLYLIFFMILISGSSEYPRPLHRPQARAMHCNRLAEQPRLMGLRRAIELTFSQGRRGADVSILVAWCQEIGGLLHACMIIPNRDRHNSCVVTWPE